MTLFFAVLVGGLFAAGFYSLLQPSLVRLIVGVILLGQGANVLLLSMGESHRGRPPLIPPDAAAPASSVSDPLTQAMILTAIVIGFGLQAFALVLIRRVVAESGTEEVDRLTASESHDGEEEGA